MKSGFGISLAVAAIFVAGSAHAEDQYCTGEGTPMDEKIVIQSLTDQGYTKIKELEMEHGCFEAKGFDSAGKRVEIYVEPATGKIVKVKS